MCVVRVERLHRFVVCVKAAIQFIEYRVAGYFDFVHIFFVFDVMPNHRMERRAGKRLVSIHVSGPPSLMRTLERRTDAFRSIESHTGPNCTM